MYIHKLFIYLVLTSILSPQISRAQDWLSNYGADKDPIFAGLSEGAAEVLFKCLALAGDPFDQSGDWPNTYRKQDIDAPKALKVCQQAYELAPTNQLTNYYYARVLLLFDGNSIQAWKFMQTAADLGFGAAFAELGQRAWDRGKRQEAFRLFKAAAEKGDVFGLTQAARMSTLDDFARPESETERYVSIAEKRARNKFEREEVARCKNDLRVGKQEQMAKAFDFIFGGSSGGYDQGQGESDFDRQIRKQRQAQDARNEANWGQ